MQRDWRYGAAIAALTIVALVRVASTHRVFSAVLDEPAHIAAGYEWLHGSYSIDASHPPLGRIIGALPLRAFPKPPETQMVPYGNALLYHGDRYIKTLARARIGNLLLLAIALIATAAWARRAFPKSVAIMSVAFLGTMPAVLGHAGVMTTDLAALTAMAVGLLALDVFMAKPSTRTAILLGVALGCGVLAKFSFLVFFPPCALILVIARRNLPLRRALIAIPVALLILWAGYRFDFRTPHAYRGQDAIYLFDVGAPEPLRPFARWTAEHVPLPAPAFFVGVASLKAHDEQGHLAYFLGEFRQKGWWYYFPAIFFYKTPIPFLLLALWGAFLLFREPDRLRLTYLFCALVILGVAMTSSINIGVRHILPLYAPLSIVAAHGAVEAWKRATDAFGRAMLAALLLWLFGGVAAQHPDYLPWFNEAAQPNTARIAIDSYLDWGQDTLRLARVLREMQIQRLHMDIMTTARVEGVEAVPFDPSRKVTGWLAVSETTLAIKHYMGYYRWLSAYRPVRRIGKSIRLYHIPE